MSKMCLAHIGVFLLALHLLTSQVIQAQDNPEMDSMTKDNSSMAPSVAANTTSDKNGSGSIAAVTLLLPLSVAASLLHGCS